MKYFRSAFIFLSVALGGLLPLAAAEAPPAKIEYAIAIHGGAVSRWDEMNATEQEQFRKSLARALEVGRKILAGGGDALDAVEQTIRAMEDDPTFNAGRGAVFNSIGTHELDASIMDGRTHQAGAVAAVVTVKNPISLARLVMTETPHVLLAGEGAEKFADEMRGNPRIERVPNTDFDTEAQRERWLKDRQREKEMENLNQKAATGGRSLRRDQRSRLFVFRDRESPIGTVGCVALDKKGNLAAGTSTGGLSNKKWGRVGDSPIIGAGTYADNATCAVSGTGIGEYFIRHSAAFHVAALMAYRGLSVDQAARQVVEKVLKPDTGGVIALDRKGQISFRFNTPGMARAAADSTGKVVIEVP
ncbi:MAG: isoaspartyl peptidase/L-asparaginase [Pirellulales bacterium]|nr:isoaspartyl peptidase/L-asparaginase [Pirellulales bacterium]